MSEQEPLQWQPLEPSQQTLEFMALREEWWQKCFSAFALSPQELGVACNPNVTIAKLSVLEEGQEA